MKKTRWIQKVLFLLVSTTLLASCGKGCQKAGPTGGALDPLDIIPANNNVLISLNWKKLNNAPLFAEVSKEMPAEAKEISKDVDDALLAVSIRGPSQPPSGLAFVQGKFDEKKILSLLEEASKKHGGELKKESFEGKTIYLSQKDPNIGMVFLSPNQAVWGQIATLKESLNLASKKGDSIRSNKELVDLFNKRDTKKLLWGAAVLPPMTPSAPAQPGDPMASLQGLKTFSLVVDYNKELSIDWTGNTQDAAQAQNFVNLLNSYKSIFGATLAAQEPVWGQVLQSAQITSQDKSITVSLRLQEDIVKQIGNKLAANAKDMKKDATPSAPAVPAPLPMPSGQAAQPPTN